MPSPAQTSESALSEIPRVSLKQRAMEQIRAAISRGELRGGEQVTELGLARKLGVSQPTIREALIELENQGFIERRAPRKTFVTRLTRQDIDEIYLVRTKLECVAVELVAGEAGRDLSKLEAAYEQMLEAASAGHAGNFEQADLQFHRALWKASGNRTLADLLERIVPKLFAFVIIQRAFATRERLLAIAQDHSRVLEALKAGNATMAVALMESSLRQARQQDSELLD